MDWTAENIARLEQLWAEGVSTTQIGLIMGCTKNAVMGKVHRLNLTPRASPIRRNVVAKPRRGRRIVSAPGRVTLPGVSPIPVQPAPEPMRVNPRETCQWPEGFPRHPLFRFCGLPIRRWPYCEFHREVAYVRTCETPNTEGWLK